MSLDGSILMLNWPVAGIPTGGGVPGEGDSGYVIAALGNTWSHTVNTRLIVQYVDARQRQVSFHRQRDHLHVDYC